MLLPQFNNTWLRRGYKTKFKSIHPYTSGFPMLQCNNRAKHKPHLLRTYNATNWCEGRNYDST